MSQMRTGIITKDKVAHWVEGMMGQAEVVAPVRLHEEDISFSVISSASEIAWVGDLSIQPPKAFLQPQTEPLFSVTKGESPKLTPIYDETERVFLAIRSCDVSAILYLDRVLSRDFEDPYYLTRRAHTTLISLACHVPPSDDCFCVCAGCGPFLQQGYDLQLTDLEDRFLVEIGSDRGNKLIEQRADLFSEASDQDRERRRILEEESHDKFGSARAYFSSSMRRITQGQVPVEFWEKIGDWSLLGGGFAYSCPCCNCFNVVDYEDGDGYLRVRIWDSCELEGHAREASGHNPRRTKGDRIRHRFRHKLHYGNVLRNESYGCVGCGRCLRAYPGLDSMPEVARRIERGEWL